MKCEKLLLEDNIIGILIGDKPVNKSVIDGITMPNLSCRKICDIAKKIGMNISYNEGTYKGYSRKQYMRDVISFCIKENKISDLFNEITKKSNFKYLTENTFLYRGDSNMRYHELIGNFYMSINEILNFDDAYLVHDNDVWYVKKFDEDIKLELPKEEIDIDFIKREYDKALQDLENNNYQHAITLCRTLLEDVFVKMLNNKNVDFKQDGGIKNYYKLVKENYNLKTNSDIDKSINELFSGLENIVNAITELRNKASDSHAFQNKKYNLKEYHIKLMINSSISISEFLINLMNDDTE